MKIKELKQILSQYDDDTEVFIDCLNDDDYETDNIWITNVREPYDSDQISKLKQVKDFKISQRPCKETKGSKKCLVL